MTVWHLHTVVEVKQRQTLQLYFFPWVATLSTMTQAASSSYLCSTQGPAEHLWYSIPSCPPFPSICYGNLTLQKYHLLGPHQLSVQASLTVYEFYEKQPGILFLMDGELSDPGICVPWGWVSVPHGEQFDEAPSFHFQLFIPWITYIGFYCCCCWECDFIQVWKLLIMFNDNFLHLPSQSLAEVLATTGQLPNPRPLSSLGPHFSSVVKFRIGSLPV